ncbi:uncharacterized protein LOC116033079 [Ipomoea triloba]|uniref:uncharacterized protein LOC116033079 n=1 Tax=Ipomoea triloba TaxID=35885 RepID=UPI00125E7A8D|nr:uncharacterized protein LOC116033079 [Ipomoea triloba]
MHVAQGNTPALATWLPPSIGRLKCNVDAALVNGCVSFGAVLRDHLGNFVAACAGRLNCPHDPYLAESMAVKEALTWLKDRTNSHVTIETDCLNFCRTFNSCVKDFSYVSVVVKQCCSIDRDIRDIVVCHVKRLANHVAHVLARAAGSFPVLSMWDSVPPSCISDLVVF